MAVPYMELCQKLTKAHILFNSSVGMVDRKSLGPDISDVIYLRVCDVFLTAIGIQDGYTRKESCNKNQIEVDQILTDWRQCQRNKLNDARYHSDVAV